MLRTMMVVALALVAACGGTAGAPGQEQAAGVAVAPGETTSSQEGSGDACIAAHEQILSDLAQIARDHADGCVSDSDCTLFDASISCQSACPAPVLAAATDDAKSAVAAYDATVCPSAPTSCGVSGSCAPIQAVCLSGTCGVQL